MDLKFTDLGDVFTDLQSYLCVIDRMSLSIACPQIREYLKIQPNDIARVIKQRLLKRGLGNLCNELTAICGIIAGPFILECLLNVEWNMPIDIYCFVDTVPSSLYIKPLHKHINHVCKPQTEYDKDSHCFEYMNYTKNNNSIIIFHRVKCATYPDLTDFVAKTWPLDCLTHYFDGYTIHINQCHELVNRLATELVNDRSVPRKMFDIINHQSTIPECVVKSYTDILAKIDNFRTSNGLQKVFNLCDILQIYTVCSSGITSSNVMYGLMQLHYITEIRNILELCKTLQKA